MSEENLTPWQKKNLEYQRRKAAESKEESEEPKKRKFLNKKEDKKVEPDNEQEEVIQNLESDAMEESETSEWSNSDDFAEDNEPEEEAKPSIFDGSFEVFKQMWPVLFITIFLFLTSVYAVSPISKIGTFTVSGNQNESFESIVKASKLRPTDRIYGVLRNRRGIENSIVQQFPRVKSVNLHISFPNNVEAKVTEFQKVAYVEQKGKTYQVLENGYILSNQAISKDKLTKLPILKSFSDQEVKTFITAYMKLKPEIRNLITTVSKAPTKATKDFIALDMSDGNQVRVSLSQISDKLPYYTNVAKQLQAPQVIDMEAGIYAKPKEEYLNDLKNPEAAKKATDDTTEAATTE
ncbi:cell division protein FtsQ/DivIB [Lactococcus garvieae]|uniref:Cell division protein DivIB n=1 Tax=Lactococcus garvieae DCC43 TaxID=1231377 RepID=K2PNJ9_9LACT|nr:cell division protein FtsQ/DivIB [Lactococcus garvieae]EKF51844.1 Cell division protein FtsQ [Lactococcus garvieae DCC43]